MASVVGRCSGSVIRQLSPAMKSFESRFFVSATVQTLLNPSRCYFTIRRGRRKHGQVLPLCGYSGSSDSRRSIVKVSAAASPSGSGLSDLVSSLTETVKGLIADDTDVPGLNGYIARVDECNTGLERYPEFPPFIVNGKIVGYIHESFGNLLQPFTDVFRLSSHFLGCTPFSAELPDPQQSSGAEKVIGNAVVLNPTLVTSEERTVAVGRVIEKLREEGHIPGWRNELYPVVSSFGEAPVLLLERAAAPLFGIKCYGVHMNGWAYAADGKKYLWVARRSPDKPTFPDKLDHLAAGGQPYGIGCGDNLVKECWEEAGIPEELARQAVPVGAVSYRSVVNATLKQDMLFCYDLQLPASFVPKNGDGEVAGFELKAVEEVAEMIRTSQEFKSNCNLVIIDFLIRHGYFTPHEPGYLSLVSKLRQGDCR